MIIVIKDFKKWYEEKYGCTIEENLNSSVLEEPELEDLAEAFMAGFRLGQEDMKRKILSAEWRSSNDMS